MATPDATTGQARLPTRRLRQPRAREAAPVDRILGRRDVALVPWGAMCAGSLAIALMTWLRNSGGAIDQIQVFGALACAAITAGIAAGLIATQHTALGIRLRSSLWAYLLVSVTLLAALAAIAIRGDGLRTPAYAGTFLLASYLGLVFPPRLRNAGLVALLATGIGVQVANPQTETLDAVMILGLTIAAWVTGTIGSRVHRWAAKAADALASYDHLTGSLNRRGLLRQADRMVDPAHRGAGPIALLIVDLDDFKTINDRDGHAVGDELLAWVGATIPDALPADAEFGRLGGDEFAVLVPHVPAHEALAIGHAIRNALAVRVGASVGIATSETRAVSPDDLTRVADAALYICKRDRTLGAHALVAGSARPTERRRGRPAKADVPPLSFARMRRSGFQPEVPKAGLAFGWMTVQGLVLIAMGGLFVVARTILEGGGSGLWYDVVRYTGVPWVSALLLLAAVSRRHEVMTERGRIYWRNLYLTNILILVGVGAAMLMDGGLGAPIGGALAMMVLFFAAIVPPKVAVHTLVWMTATVLLVAVLGPASALWVLPFNLTVLGAAFALGSIGFRALADVTTAAMDQAHTDELTGLRNRFGFQEFATVALEQARAGDEPFALLALDLDDFKGINDTRGHAAGDTILREVAAVLRDTCPDATAICRLGGDEFVVVMPIGSSTQAAALARAITDSAAPTVGASVGHAVFPGDGTTLEALLHAADHRSYSSKRAKPTHPVAQLAPFTAKAA